METLTDVPHSTLSGAARVLVHAGRLSAKTAEDLVKGAKERKTGFVASVLAAGALSPSDLAHTLSGSLALPLLDLNAVDPQRLPRNIIDGKLAAQYQVVVLGKRGNRLFIGGSDPTDQEAVERIKFATQLTPEWVIVEHDKLVKILEATGTSASEALDSTTSRPRSRRTPHRPKWKTRLSCASCRRC
jgi:type IV pilus assembly protein PilB